MNIICALSKRSYKLHLRWRKVASLGQGKREDLSHACVVYNGSILLMGGQGEGEQVRSDDPNFVEHYQQQYSDT